VLAFKEGGVVVRSMGESGCALKQTKKKLKFSPKYDRKIPVLIVFHQESLREAVELQLGLVRVLI
jgi:hypothetical protein